MRTIVAGTALAAASAFIETIKANSVRVLSLDTAGEAIAALSAGGFDLLVAAEDLGDMSGLELIEAVVKSSPMLNCAVVSSLSPEDYHEASEGLGILMQLPPDPGPEEAVALVNHLKKIRSFGVGP